MNANEKERFLGCRNLSFIIRSSFKMPILFSSIHSGLSGPKKKEAWQHITDAVNGVSSVNQTVPEVRRKWFNIKLDSKKTTKKKP